MQHGCIHTCPSLVRMQSSQTQQNPSSLFFVPRRGPIRHGAGFLLGTGRTRGKHGQERACCRGRRGPAGRAGIKMRMHKEGFLRLPRKQQFWNFLTSACLLLQL